jgi:hypothetical protein
MLYASQRVRRKAKNMRIDYFKMHYMLLVGMVSVLLGFTLGIGIAQHIIHEAHEREMSILRGNCSQQ